MSQEAPESTFILSARLHYEDEEGPLKLCGKCNRLINTFWSKNRLGIWKCRFGSHYFGGGECKKSGKVI